MLTKYSDELFIFSHSHLAVAVSSVVVMTPMHRENLLKKQTNTICFYCNYKVKISPCIGVITVRTHTKVLVPRSTLDSGIGLAELETCTEDDLKEAGLPLGPRKRLLTYLTGRSKRRSGFDEFQASSVARQVSYNVSRIHHIHIHNKNMYSLEYLC